MKLHLPKLLFAALMAAFAMPTMGADGPIKWDPSSGDQHSTLLDATKVQQDGNGNTYLDVYLYEGYDTWKYNWYGDLVIGDTAESTGHVENVGSFVGNWVLEMPTDSVATPDLQVHGNVTVQGNGKVVLGGKYNDARYMGIEATGITVNGGSLTATKIRANDLEVTGGTVSTSTPGCSTGSYMGSLAYSYIQNSLTISGGSLSFGYDGDDITGIDNNRGLMTVFGNTSFSMTQTGGTMNVYGATSLIAGADITQKDDAGATVLRDTVFLQGSGSTKFNQSADEAKLIIGRLESTGSKSVHNVEFNQSGGGEIHLAYGSNFRMASTITLNQTGAGTINIGGGHNVELTGTLPTGSDGAGYALGAFECINTTYNITQTGAGTINVNDALTAGIVTISGESKLNLNADMTADSLIQSGNGVVTLAEGKKLTVDVLTIDGGVFENKGTLVGSIELNGGEYIAESDTSLGTGPLELNEGATLNLSSSEVDNDIEAAGGTLKGADQYNGNLVVSKDLIIEGNITANSITLLDDAGIKLQAATTTFSRRTTPAGAEARTNAMYVRTEGDGRVDGDLTLNAGGLIELNNGNSLVVAGTLTLGRGVTFVLNGNGYQRGSVLATAEDGVVGESGRVDVAYGYGVYEISGNTITLQGIFNRIQADMAVQSNWGIATTSRAFVNMVRGQHSHTGCIANGRGTVWAAALGAYNDMDGADISVQGAAVGVDAKVGERSTMGLAVGYADGDVSPTGLREVDQEGTYVALYGEHGLKKLSSTSSLNLDWVAAYGRTESKADELKWEQDSLQLNTRLNWSKELTDRLCMSVFGGLEYFATDSDTSRGVKSGSIQNLRGEIGVGAHYVAWGTPDTAPVVDEKGGLVSAGTAGCRKLVLHGELRYFNDMVRSNPVVEMDGLRGDGENPGRHGMGIEAGATYRISERWSTSANYSFNAMEDSTEHRVNVGASYSF